MELVSVEVKCICSPPKVTQPYFLPAMFNVKLVLILVINPLCNPLLLGQHAVFLSCRERQWLC